MKNIAYEYIVIWIEFVNYENEWEMKPFSSEFVKSALINL